jgi:hypothetical protein
LCSPFASDEEDPKRFAADAPTDDTLVVDEPPPQEVDPAAKPQKASKKPTKKVVTIRSSKRLQKASDTGVTLEAHQSTSSSDDVRKHTIIFTSKNLRVDAHILFSGQDLMKRFVDLGNDCIECLKVAKASEGESHFFYTCLSVHACPCFFA